MLLFFKKFRFFMKNILFFLILFISFCNVKLNSKEYFILSIDGGGSRGVVPATILKNLENDIGGSCAEVFDCISGTSTGSMIAAALTMPDPKKMNYPKYKAEDILEIYLDDIPKIFANSIFYSIKTLWGWYGPKYQKDYLENYLNEKFKGYKMTESLTDLIITSYDLIREKGFYFENFKNLDKSINNDYSVIEAILASTSAPSYFSPEILKNNNGEYALVDGGMIADDPSALTLRECIKNINLKDTTVYILSLGCGTASPEKINVTQIEKWGLIEYLPEIIDSLFESIQVDSNEELECLKKLMNLNYIRVNINISQDEYVIDITDKKILYGLMDKAENFYINDFKKSKDGQNLIQLLKKRLKDKKSKTI